MRKNKLFLPTMLPLCLCLEVQVTVGKAYSLEQTD